MKSKLKALGTVLLNIALGGLLVATAMTLILVATVTLGLNYGVTDVSTLPDMIIWLTSSLFVVIVASAITIKLLFLLFGNIVKAFKSVMVDSKEVIGNGSSEENDDEDKENDSEYDIEED